LSDAVGDHYDSPLARNVFNVPRPKLLPRSGWHS
jgi:hypothetical protein